MSTQKKHIHDRWSYAWLFLAGIFVVISAGRWMVPLAAWLAPIFMMRYLRTQPLLRGYLLGVLFFLFPAGIALWGQIPQPPVEFFVTLIIGGFIGLLPFLLDRWLAANKPSFLHTLLFPTFAVAFEYFNAQGNPFGTWGSTAYTQAGQLPLIQSVSFAGIWGLIFLMSWSASTINWAWEHNFTWETIQKGLLTYLLLLVTIICGGGIRLATAPMKPTFRAAGIVTPENKKLRSLIEPVFFEGKQPTPALWKTYFERARAVHADLLSRTAQAAQAGAKVIVWAEAQAPIQQKDEKAFLQKVQSLAKQHKVYIGATMWLFRHLDIKNKKQKMTENKLVFVTPQGKIGFEYLKTIPVPGPELAMVQKGDGKMKTINTPYGTIGAMICFDMDFPHLVKQASQKQVDLLIVPASDWKDITPHHTRIASFRAIENGFSLLRVTDHGESASYDSYGRHLAGMNYFTTNKYILYTDIPMKSKAWTPYSLLGDLLGMLCFFLTIGLIGWGGWNTWRQRKNPTHA